MRIGLSTLLVVAVAASLLVGCSSTGTTPDAGLGKVIGSLDGQPPSARAFPDTWGGRVSYTTDYGFEDDVDDKDEGLRIDDQVTTWSNRMTVRFDGPLPWEGSWLIGRLNYEYLYYDWDHDPQWTEDAGFLSLDMWLMQGLAKDWAVGILPRISSNTSMGAEFDDGFGGFIGVGVVHMFSDDLSVGIGGLFARSFDDEWFAYPAIQGIWSFAENWELRVLGPRAEVRWQMTDKFLLKTGVEANNHRWLLDMPGEIAMEDFRVPIYIGLEFGVADRFQLDARIAYDVFREITFDDEGDDEASWESEGTASISAGATWYF